MSTKNTIHQPRAEVLGYYLELVEKLTLNGALPSPTWLKNNGYVNLYHYILAHPPEFDHIQFAKQQRSHNNRTLKMRRKQVKRLIKEKQYKDDGQILHHSGEFPSLTWLRAHGFAGLVCYIGKYPRFFKDISKIRCKHKSEYERKHVFGAEELATKHGGSLPGGGTIIKENGWALYKFMRRRPDLFAHISGALPPEPSKSRKS